VNGEGRVEVRTVLRKSCMIRIWTSAGAIEEGTTAAPISSALWLKRIAPMKRPVVESHWIMSCS